MQYGGRSGHDAHSVVLSPITPSPHFSSPSIYIAGSTSLVAQCSPRELSFGLVLEKEHDYLVFGVYTTFTSIPKASSSRYRKKFVMLSQQGSQSSRLRRPFTLTVSFIGL